MFCTALDYQYSNNINSRYLRKHMQHYYTIQLSNYFKCIVNSEVKTSTFTFFLAVALAKNVYNITYM